MRARIVTRSMNLLLMLTPGSQGENVFTYTTPTSPKCQKRYIPFHVISIVVSIALHIMRSESEFCFEFLARVYGVILSHSNVQHIQFSSDREDRMLVLVQVLCKYEYRRSILFNVSLFYKIRDLANLVEKLIYISSASVSRAANPSLFLHIVETITF